MKLGQRMVRLDDGMKGIVAQNGPELRIIYTDRGEERMAPRNERWVPDELHPGPLRAEEKMIVAWWADRALQAYETNTPLKVWEKPDVENDVVYDQGLFETIIGYLTSRETLPADAN